MADASIPLQTDQVSTVPGGGIRMATASVLINGIPTQVQMQVITLADGNGALLAPSADLVWQRQILQELREVRRLLATFMGVPAVMPTDIPDSLSINPT